MDYFWVLVILFIVIFGWEFVLRKWLGVDKGSLAETPAKIINQWVSGIMIVLVLCIVPFMLLEEDSRFIWFLIVVFIASNLFQAFLEWKYLKSRKQYLVTLLHLPVTISILIFIAFWYF